MSLFQVVFQKAWFLPQSFCKCFHFGFQFLYFFGIIKISLLFYLSINCSWLIHESQKLNTQIGIYVYCKEKLLDRLKGADLSLSEGVPGWLASPRLEESKMRKIFKKPAADIWKRK